MKKIYTLLFATTFIPALSFASWQVAGKTVRTHGAQANKTVNDIPKSYRSNPRYRLQTVQGLLLTNVQFYVKQHHWHLKWMTRRRWPVNLKSRLEGPSFQTTLNELLSHYPLKAYYNKRKHTVTIADKTKR